MTYETALAAVQKQLEPLDDEGRKAFIFNRLEKLTKEITELDFSEYSKSELAEFETVLSELIDTMERKLKG